MIIYRIEDSAGYGPYRDLKKRSLTRAQLSGLKKMDKYHRSTAWPPPWQDNIAIDKPFTPFDPCDTNGESLQESYVCGFDSVEKLIEWFSGFESLLESCGFTVSEYELDSDERGSVFFGDKQVVFKRELTHLTASREIQELFHVYF